jgi:hypothetical protein
MKMSKRSPEFEAWLLEVGKYVKLTPDQIVERAGDEPEDLFDYGDTPLKYAEHFLGEAEEYFGEGKPETEDYSSVERIRRLSSSLEE